MFEFVKKTLDKFSNWISSQFKNHREASELSPLLEPKKTAVQNPYHVRRILYKGIAICAIALDAGFVIFLYKAMFDAGKYALKSLDADSKYAEKILAGFCGVLGAVDLVGELLIVNPIEAAESLLPKTNPSDSNHTSRHSCTDVAISSFGWFNWVLAQPTYLIGGTADAISIAYLSKSPLLKFGYGTPVTLLAFIYYNLFMQGKIEKHAEEFLKHFLNFRESILWNMLRSPGRSLEVIMQSVCNALYRSVCAAYIMDQLLRVMFDQGNSQVIFDCVVPTFFITFYSSVFSRTLNVINKYYNPEMAKIDRNILKQTSISKLGLCIDALMTVLRAGPASILIHRYGPQNMYLNGALSIGAGLILAGQSLHVRYNLRLRETAITRTSAAASSLSDENDFVTFAELFEHKKKSNATRGTKMVATMFNVSSRVARSIAFLGFLVTLNQDILPSRELNFLIILCIHQLWGNPTFENELSFFGDFIESNIVYYKTKFQLSKEGLHSFGFFASLFKSIHEYPSEKPRAINC
jgi:hypothetical protein